MEKNIKIGRFTIVDFYWLDDDTFVGITDSINDEDGISFNIECEYHADTDTKHYIRVYDEEALDGEEILTKEEIDGFSNFLESHKND